MPAALDRRNSFSSYVFASNLARTKSPLAAKRVCKFLRIQVVVVDGMPPLRPVMRCRLFKPIFNQYNDDGVLLCHPKDPNLIKLAYGGNHTRIHVKMAIKGRFTGLAGISDKFSTR